MPPPAFFAAPSARDALCRSLIGLVAVIGRECDPDARRRPCVLGHLREAILERLLDPPHVDFGVARAARLRLEDGELVVADACEALGLVDQDHQPFADELEEGVGFRLAEELVHRAKAVDVDEMDRELARVLDVRFDLPAERVQELLPSAEFHRRFRRHGGLAE